jgi:hypothetical protein
MKHRIIAIDFAQLALSQNQQLKMYCILKNAFLHESSDVKPTPSAKPTTWAEQYQRHNSF